MCTLQTTAGLPHCCPFAAPKRGGLDVRPPSVPQATGTVVHNTRSILHNMNLIRLERHSLGDRNQFNTVSGTNILNNNNATFVEDLNIILFFLNYFEYIFQMLTKMYLKYVFKYFTDNYIHKYLEYFNRCIQDSFRIVFLCT